MNIDDSSGKKKWITAFLLLMCLAFCAALFKAYLDGRFHSVETLQRYIAGFGLLGPVILTGIQAVQVVLPVLPGFLGCIVGAVLLDGWEGSGVTISEYPQVLSSLSGWPENMAKIWFPGCFPENDMKNGPLGQRRADSIQLCCFSVWYCHYFQMIFFVILPV